MCVLQVPELLVCDFVMPLFGKSHKSPTDIVRTLKENLAIVVKHDKKTEKVGGVFLLFWVSGVQGPKGDRSL